MSEAGRQEAEPEKNGLLERFLPPAEGRSLKERLLSLPGDPHFVALGAAIGVYISFTPLIPFHMVLAFCLALLLRGSKAAALLGTYVSNPITIPFQYFAAYKTGSVIWRYPVEWHPHGLSLREVVSMGWEFAAEMATGGFINGLLPALAAYGILRILLRNLEKAKDPA